jgi:protein-disulfide isomerase
LWLEYSDMQCPFCARLHNSWTKDELYKKYWTKLSYSLQHFPLWFHSNALSASEALECIAKQKWEKSYFELEDIIFRAKNSNLDFITEKAVKLWVNKEILEKCIENKEFIKKIEAQQKLWTETFWITWTPWNVLINTKTWEYEVISGAYPTSSFVEIIDKLLK